MKPINKRSLSIITISILAFFLISSCKSCNKKTEENKITYSTPTSAVFPEYDQLTFNTYEISADARLSDTGALLMIVKLLQITNTEKYFDISKPMKEGDQLWYIGLNDPSAMINVNLMNGDVTIDKGMAAYRQDSSTKALVKGDAAVRMAKEYLQKLNITEDEKNMVMAHVGGLNLAVHNEGDKGENYEKFTTVRFDRKLDGIPVIGHSRIIVQLAEEGSLHGIIRQWSPFTATQVKKEEILSKDSLKRNFEKYVMSENTDAQKINITSIELVYYDNGKGQIEPAIRAKGETEHMTDSVNKKTTKFPYDIIVPLLKNPRATYSFMHDNFKNAIDKKSIDDTKNQEPMKRGDEER